MAGQGKCGVALHMDIYNGILFSYNKEGNFTISHKCILMFGRKKCSF